jgi:hypothetical protein
VGKNTGFPVLTLLNCWFSIRWILAPCLLANQQQESDDAKNRKKIVGALASDADTRIDETKTLFY